MSVNKLTELMKLADWFGTDVENRPKIEITSMKI